jgi:hypothetical protein
LPISRLRAPLVFLERIAVDWNRMSPLYFNRIDRIHVVGGSLAAIPADHELV